MESKIRLWRGLCNTFRCIQNFSNHEKHRNCHCFARGGLIIGSALTMLFTPQSGPELRRKIKDTLDSEIDRVKNKLSEVEEQIEEARCRCSED